jgi:RNA polymerase sigma-70 factor (ECF subfamily)
MSSNVTKNEDSTSASERQLANRAMERYAQGDRSAFDEVYRYMAPRLYTYLLRRCRDRAYAEDLMQQTFLRMHRARASFEAGGRLAPWAFTIATRLLVDGSRAPGRKACVPMEDEPVASCSADEVVHARQLMHVVDRELGRMSPGQRSAFHLVRQQGLSHAAAASALGVSVTAIKLRLHRARVALQMAIAGVAA